MQKYNNQQKQNKKQEQEQQTLMNFDNFFKKQGNSKRNIKKNLPSSSETNIINCNWLLQIPTQLKIRKQDVEKMKYFNHNRWNFIMKINNSSNKLLAAVLSCWNYLFIKNIDEKITIKIAQNICFKQNQEIPQEFDRSQLAIKWFLMLCKYKKVNGKASIAIKLTEPNKKDGNIIKYCQSLLEGLQNSNYSYLYLTYNNVVCPIGYQITPLIPLQAYKKLNDIDTKNRQLWIINSSLSSKEQPLLIKRWKHIINDLTSQWPQYFDLNQTRKGKQIRPQVTQENKNLKKGSSNCIIKFMKK